MCEYLEVSRSAYYAWINNGCQTRRIQRDEKALKLIKESLQQNKEAYGSVKIYRDLCGKGHKIGKNTVARIMKENKLQNKYTRAFKVTTKANPSHSVANNELNQCFHTDAPNRVWVCDTTFIKTATGWMYLAIVLDLYSRMIVGYAMSTRNTQELTTTALEMAIRRRKPRPGFIVHSDRGSQYTAHAHQAIVTCHKGIVSMSSTGNCYDNAVAESFFGTLKIELVFGQRFANILSAKLAVFEYIQGFYNRTRLHATLNYMSPIDYENQSIVA